MSYIEGNQADSAADSADDAVAQAVCIFCGALEENDGPGNLIVHRDERSFVILNLYPYTSGHLMIVPFVHVPSLEYLDADTQAELIHTVSKAIQILRHSYKAESFNVGINIGEPAGAGVADHVHIHVVPRWPGDTSFISTTGNTRVIPEALEATYQRIRLGWDTDDVNQPMD
jgi:ATP adenylyltransferase